MHISYDLQLEAQIQAAKASESQTAKEMKKAKGTTRTLRLELQVTKQEEVSILRKRLSDVSQLVKGCKAWFHSVLTEGLSGCSLPWTQPVLVDAFLQWMHASPLLPICRKIVTG